jgi:UDP-glucose 4-epimerase
MATILIVGGAGYIGSHVVRELAKCDHNIIIFDNLSEGHEESIYGFTFVKGDINKTEDLANVFGIYKIDVVMHFSAYAYVGESVKDPKKYYYNNVGGTINLLSAMLKNNIKYFIFSSSCATYGNPIYIPIDEKHPQNPINPYGTTKYIVEKILSDYDRAYNLKYISLRYFNAAGAQPDGAIGESHKIETHLIPLIMKTLIGEIKNIKIYGTDYKTPDGTCVRDYIHVCDLAIAHRLSLDAIFYNRKSRCINLGTGIGVSVKEVITACEKVTGLKVPLIYSNKRPGDPPILVAANKYAKDVLNFSPLYTDIHDIIKTAWNWEKNRRY